MRNRKLIYSFSGALFILSLILAGIIFYSKSQELKVIFLDVGQGDAILVGQGSKQILIDGGPSGQAILDKLGKYIPFWDRNIEMIIATHPDADHITGLVDAMKNYRVGAIIDPDASSDSQIFQKYKEIIAEKNIQNVKAEQGEKINLADNASMEILNPETGTLWDMNSANANSIVVRLISGENSFLFTGDLPSEQEAQLISNNINLNSKILKVAHHGSKYSTSAEFLDAVKPLEAVISVGKNNRYGHPAPEILDRLKAKNINILRTDENGDISYDCQPDNICVLVPH